MALVVIHTTAGRKLTQAEYEAGDSHQIAGELSGDHGDLEGLTDDDHTQYILKALFNAHSIIYSISDNTPVQLTMGASTVLARLASGNIVAATPAEVKTLLGIAADIATHAALTATHGVAGTIAEVADIAATKLDDFATPDDNTDLNATTSVHGLLKKLDNTATNFMNGQGNWATPTYYGTVVKEMWWPCTMSVVPSDGIANHGNFAGVYLDTNGQYAFTTFTVPATVSSIVAVDIIVIPRATQASANWNLHASYSAVGEDKDANNETETAATYNVTDDELFAVDATPALSSLAAGDIGAAVLQVGSVGHTVHVLGVRLKYT